ncbi:O-antigen ligase family protein [Coleofasciculus sp.]|uniref:O-antigen ligase family protein n=1 Tax=Coleofasciculus sp. TaxID=3100458 RepID=UPI0039F8A231
MKQLLLHPLVFTLLLGVAFLYIVIGFQLISRQPRWGEIVERVFIILSMLIIGGMNIAFSGRFQPRNLYEPEVSLAYRIMALGLYALFFILLLPRLYYTIQELRYTWYFILNKTPAFCAYIMIINLSFMVSETPEHTLKASLVFFIVTVCFIYVGQQYNVKEIFDVLLWYHIVVLFLSLIFGNKVGSWHGIYLHKNVFGATMAMAFTLMYLQSIRQPKYKFLFLSLAALALFCVFQSQGGLARVLLVVLISLLGFLSFIRRLPPRLAFASMAVFLAIGISIAILITENAEYIIVEKLGKDMTLTGRTYVWYRVVNAINRHPWLGYGYEGFWQFWQGSDNPGLAITVTEAGGDGFIPHHSHDGYLDVGLNSGWLGLALLIVSLLTAIYYGSLHLTRHKNSEALFPLITLTWIVMINTTDGGIEQISIPWILSVVMTTRLTMETVENFQPPKSIAFKSKFPLK